MTDPASTRVLLLRHAETAAPDRFHGAESDVPLGPRGFEQATRAALDVAPALPSAVYSSDMLRASQTAEAIARACLIEAVEVPELHERRMGRLSGMLMTEGWDAYVAAMTQWKAGNLDAAHEGGESFAQISDRVVPAMNRLAQRHRGETIVVVAHGVVIRVLLACWLGEGPSRFDQFGIDFVAVNDLRFDDRGWRACALNGASVGD